MKLYQKDGWFNAPEVIRQPENFIFITGARGTGKTYGVLKWLISNKKCFIYLRRTQDEADMQGRTDTSSLTKILEDLNLDFEFSKISKKIYLLDVPRFSKVYMCALSTFSTVRGVNFDSVEYIVYDEMIPEVHAHRFRMEGLALMNLYETVNRNRELEGKPAVKLIGLSNSLNIANDVFIEFGLIQSAERLLSAESEEYERLGNKLLIIMKHSPISEKKAGTALYAAASEQFIDMAIKNKFIMNDFSYVKKRPLQQYRPYINIGDLTVYEHKSEDEYYVSFSYQKSDIVYKSNANDLKRFRRAEMDLWLDYLDGFVRFENYRAVALFEKYFAVN